MRKTLTILSLALLLSVLPLAAQEAESEKKKTSLWNQVIALYEEAKETGETVTDDVYEWAREDLQSIGDWEYKVDYLPNPNHIALEKRLNEYGAERWELVWIDRQGPNLIITMKRHSRSWLNKLPLGELIKLAAPGGAGDGGG